MHISVDRRRLLRSLAAGAVLLLPVRLQAQAILEEFMYAVTNDFADKVQGFLARGVDPNSVASTGEPALLIAARAGNARTVDLLLAAPGIKVDARSSAGDTPLMAAAIAGRLDMIRKLRARGAEINMRGWTPLIYAATGGREDVIRYLLAEGADINAQAPNGTSALMMAVREGQISVAELLIAKGANVNVRNEQGATALDWAKRNDDGPMIERLRRAGARE